VPLAVAMLACDLVIAPDPIVLASIQRSLRWRPGMETAMIPVAANVWPDANGSPTGEAAKGHELTIGYWGFLRPDKGVDLLLEAFARIRETRPAQLVLAGDPGPDATYITSLKRHADDLGVSASIRTTGKLSAEGLSAELLSFDACVLPFRDGLSQNRGTYAGAVAHGLYVVTTGLNRHGYEPETNTSFVPPNDRGALISAILDAPGHPRRQSSVAAEDAWNEIADFHLAAYQKARGRP
jgi:glycosyltransferase involved in cell wall biosynthesis